MHRLFAKGEVRCTASFLTVQLLKSNKVLRPRWYCSLTGTRMKGEYATSYDKTMPSVLDGRHYYMDIEYTHMMTGRRSSIDSAMEQQGHLTSPRDLDDVLST